MLIGRSANSQSKWIPELQLPLKGETAAYGKDLTISQYLAKEVPFKTKEDGCRAELSIFYFRVNSKGMVDSIYVEGNLDKVAVDVIKKNIRSTDNKWKVPRTTSRQSECWFVFPFFDAGRSKLCSEDLLRYRNQLIQVLEMYSGSRQTTDRMGRVLLPPNDIVLLSHH